MPHRLLDSFEWEKAWFRKLESKYKCFWVYINTRCNHYGMWKMDLESAEFLIGEHLEYDEIVKRFGDKIYLLEGSEEWFVPEFLINNYRGKIDKNKFVHKYSYPILLDLGIIDSDGKVRKAFGNALVNLKDKEKDKDIIKDKSIEKDIVTSKEENISINKEIALEKNNEIDKEKDQSEDKKINMYNAEELEKEIIQVVTEGKVLEDNSSKSLAHVSTPNDLNVTDHTGKPIYY